MKKRRLLACALCLSVALTSVVGFAAGFKDVDEDPTVSWAKDSIQAMADSGYIKGYEDGTFKPYRSISKIEALLLMARILGAEESAYEEVATDALDVYSDTVGKYNTTYLNELTYLLYNGIVDETDLNTYASSGNANGELTRWQAAILMAKLLGANSEAKAFTVGNPTYPDDAEIPATAKPYVEYVTANNIMNGMASTDGSATVFSPNTSLTRAQMATLLNRMISKVNKMTYVGTIAEMNLNSNLITIDRNGSESKRKINKDTVVYQNGVQVELADLIEGSEIRGVEIGGHIQSLNVITEGIDESKNTEFYGKIAILHNSNTDKKLTIADPEDSKKTKVYPVSDQCTYTVGGAKANYSDLRKGDFIRAIENKGVIVAIEITESNFVVNGTLVDVTFDDSNGVHITISKEGSGNQEYTVSKDGATVVRNNLSAEYRSLTLGDSVKLTITNGKVTRVVATSTTESFNGILREIHITAEPYVVIESGSKQETYTLRNDVVIKVAGENADIYDLRRNISVNVTLDGKTVRTLNATTVSTTENGEFIGTLAGVNTNYKVLSIEDSEGNMQSVYYNAKTAFLKSNGNATTAGAMEIGSTVSVTGVEKNGLFEATIVIVK
ncbi:MAG: S-layer homology domain-containing protein [Clostridia bacterium]|nr:S-layer homology domain-containing protein [Clostridia bacterium]